MVKAFWQGLKSIQGQWVITLENKPMTKLCSALPSTSLKDQQSNPQLNLLYYQQFLTWLSKQKSSYIHHHYITLPVQWLIKSSA